MVCHIGGDTRRIKSTHNSRDSRFAPTSTRTWDASKRNGCCNTCLQWAHHWAQECTHPWRPRRQDTNPQRTWQQNLRRNKWRAKRNPSTWQCLPWTYQWMAIHGTLRVELRRTLQTTTPILQAHPNIQEHFAREGPTLINHQVMNQEIPSILHVLLSVADQGCIVLDHFSFAKCWIMRSVHNGVLILLTEINVPKRPKLMCP